MTADSIEITILSDYAVDLTDQDTVQRIRNLAEAGLTLEELRAWCKGVWPRREEN